MDHSLLLTNLTNLSSGWKTKTNLPKSFNPPPLNQLINAHVCAMPRAKIRAAEVSNCKEDDSVFPPRSYYLGQGFRQLKTRRLLCRLPETGAAMECENKCDFV